jgi:hypothetical protein
MTHADQSHRANLEVLESRVLLSGPPTKFVIPIGGTPQLDWAIQAYTDQDPAVGSAIDYRGRGYTFDGSNSVHFGLADLAGMDRGVDIYAAAPGTVLEAHDGEYDRHLVILDPPPQDNYVLIDHGDGWLTRYGHMRNGSVAVSPGQVVTAGQLLGLVGASGNFAANYGEADAFLNFDVTHNGEHIETFLDPQAYWEFPPPFAGDVPTVFEMFTTETAPTNDAADGYQVDEHISRRRVFHPGDQVWTLTLWHGLNGGVYRQYRYFRPDGSSFTDPGNTPVLDLAHVWRRGSYILPSNAQLGTWQVAALFNGVELGRTSFIVADPSAGLPEIKIYQDTTYVIDGRTTPIDFGSILQDGGTAVRDFTIFNYGTQPLTLGQITLPAGFGVVAPAPTTIPSGSSQVVTLQLLDQIAGSKGGRITIHSNDADQAEFDFAVKGSVVGIAATVNAGDFLYETSPQRLRFTFSQNVSASLSAADLRVENLTTGAPAAVLEPTYDVSTNTATFGFTGILPDGNYLATILASGILNFETPMAADDKSDFFVLTGDLNHDRTVSIADFIALASNFNRTDVSYSDGDINYDGTVSIADFIDLASNFNKTLVAPSASPAPQAAAAIAVSDTTTLEESILCQDRDRVGLKQKRTAPSFSRSTQRRQPHHRRHSCSLIRWKGRGGIY